MTKRKITERMVEGAHAQNQYKIETIPGYAEAFQRVSNCLKKSVEPGYITTQDDKDELDRAMAELYMIEFFGCK
jgi:hypothetical protein